MDKILMKGNEAIAEAARYDREQTANGQIQSNGTGRLRPAPTELAGHRFKENTKRGLRAIGHCHD